MIPRRGLHENVPFEEYLSWDAASRSALVTLTFESPGRLAYLREHPEDSGTEIVDA